MPPMNRMASLSRVLVPASTKRPCLLGLTSAMNPYCAGDVALKNLVVMRSTTLPTPRYATATSFAEHRKSATISDTPSVFCDVKVLPGNRGNIATITVSNPRKLNIVNSDLFLQMHEAFQKLAKDDSLRAVVLTGAKTHNRSQAFIGGADIAEMFTIDTPDKARSFISKIHDLCTAIRTHPVPVIAKIDGFCLGAGLEIMASCDLRIATKDSIFGMPEVKVGIPCVVEARLLCDLVGWGRARRLIYLAENIDSAKAEAWGLVEGVVADKAELDKTTDDWVAMIANGGAVAIRDQKILCKSWEEGSVDEGIEAGVESFAQSFADGGQEPKRMMDAFVNRKR